jgi:hypothetical protein
VPVDRPNIDRSICAAARAMNVKPWHAGSDCAADSRRPQHALPGLDRGVPSLDDTHRIIMGSLLGRACAHVEGKAVGASRIMFRHADKYRAASGKTPPIRPCV